MLLNGKKQQLAATLVLPALIKAEVESQKYLKI